MQAANLPPATPATYLAVGEHAPGVTNMRKAISRNFVVTARMAAGAGDAVKVRALANVVRDLGKTN